MATTATKIQSIQTALNQGNITNIADLFRILQLGFMLQAIKVTFSGLTSSATQVITNAAAASKATVARGIVLDQYQPTLPPIGEIVSCRVTAGSAYAGNYIPCDSGGTAINSSATYPGTVLVSDDGTTLTFSAAVTGFVLVYFPASTQGDLSTIAFPWTTP